jgi:hypothetical protein
LQHGGGVFGAGVRHGANRRDDGERLVGAAAEAGRFWVSDTTKPLHRFRAAVLIGNASGETVWAGGVFERAERPGADALLELFGADAAQALERKGYADRTPISVHVANLFELPQPPRPAPGDARPLRNWKVEVDFVCHDIKFGYLATGVFQWPEEPRDGVLSAMGNMLMADALALRGDGPDWVDYCDVNGLKATETAEPSDYPLG